MAGRYRIKYSNRSVEMSKPNSTILLYKIPYRDVEKKRINFTIPNEFIVYILFGKNDEGKDVIYVGKSKNGIEHRPTAHKDKFNNWTTCYILTQFKERTFFNDGAIQYIENEINTRIDEVGWYDNTTKATTAGTANVEDQENCDDYLDEMYSMLNILGLDLITNSEEDIAEQETEKEISRSESKKLVPNGIYTLDRKIKRFNNEVFHGVMEVKDGKFIAKAGSNVTPDLVDRAATVPDLVKKRNEAKIENGILMEDVVFNSPSLCGTFIIGGFCNGWTNWNTSDGKPIDIYRKANAK